MTSGDFLWQPVCHVALSSPAIILTGKAMQVNNLYAGAPARGYTPGGGYESGCKQKWSRDPLSGRKQRIGSRLTNEKRTIKLLYKIGAQKGSDYWML